MNSTGAGLREHLVEANVEEFECADLGQASYEPLGSDDDSDDSESDSVRPREDSMSPASPLERRGLRYAYYVVAGCLLGMALPALFYTLASERAAGRYYLLPLAITFVSCAVPISVRGIARHVTN